jgi:hypothetical protein
LAEKDEPIQFSFKKLLDIADYPTSSQQTKEKPDTTDKSDISENLEQSENSELGTELVDNDKITQKKAKSKPTTNTKQKKRKRIVRQYNKF